MKKLLILLTLLLSMTHASAQVPIKSVFGVSLGDSKATVEAALRRQGKMPKEKTTKDGKSYFSISNPTLGDCTFEGASFIFNGSLLDKAIFFSSEACVMDPNFSGQTNGYQVFTSKAERYQRIFNMMRGDLMDKYGRPAVDTDGKCVWRSGKNQIILTYEFKDEPTSYGWRDGFTRVAVEYSVRTSSNF